MIDDRSVNLLNAVDDEINRAFLFLNDARMPESKERRGQLLMEAMDALERAKGRSLRVPKELVPPYWGSFFSEVESRLSKLSKDPL